MQYHAVVGERETADRIEVGAVALPYNVPSVSAKPAPLVESGLSSVFACSTVVLVSPFVPPTRMWPAVSSAPQGLQAAGTRIGLVEALLALDEGFDLATILVDDARVVGDERAGRLRLGCSKQEAERPQAARACSVNYPKTMTENQFGRLLADLWADLQEPAILWQIGTLALCLLAAGGSAGCCSGAHRKTAARRSSEARRLSGASLSRCSPCCCWSPGARRSAYWHKHEPAERRDSAVRRAGRHPFAAVPAAPRDSRARLAGCVRALDRDGGMGRARAAPHRPAAEIVHWLADVAAVGGKHEAFALDPARRGILGRRDAAARAVGGAALEARLMRAEDLHSSLRVVFARLARPCCWCGSVLALPLIGVDLTVLSVFGGALGVGLGLDYRKSPPTTYRDSSSCWTVRSGWAT
jgi:hypothetical protein